MFIMFRASVEEQWCHSIINLMVQVKHLKALCSLWSRLCYRMNKSGSSCSCLMLLMCVFQSCTTTEETTMSLCLLWKTWLGQESSHSPRRLTLSSRMWRNPTNLTLARMSNYGELLLLLIVVSIEQFSLSVTHSGYNNMILFLLYLLAATFWGPQ